MLRHGVRLLVAMSTFTIAISIVWILNLIPNLETVLLDRFWSVNKAEVTPVRLVVDSAEDANEIYRLLIQQRFTFNDEIKLIVLQSKTTGFPIYEDESVKKEWVILKHSAKC
jgi:hypothetical protein